MPCGPGIERIDEEVAALFPEARRVLLSSDLTPGVSDLRETLREIEDREVDIIIGTQLVAKGHHSLALRSSAWSTRILASPMPTRAPPNGRFSSSIR